MKLGLQTVGYGFGFLRASQSDSLRGDQRGRWSRDTHHLFVSPPQIMVFSIDGFECRNPLVLPALVEPKGHRNFRADTLGSQSGESCKLPMPPQAVLQAYLILDGIRYRRACVVTRATVATSMARALQNGAGDVLNVRVNSFLFVIIRFERNMVFQMSIEIGPISLPEVREIWWVMEG